MLSKLRWNNSLSDVDIQRRREEIIPDRVLSSINWHNVVVERIDQGTLSASFTVHAGMDSAFLKTHLTSEGRLTLERESQFLGLIYAEALSNRVHSLYEPDINQMWLMMPFFERNQTQLRPDEVVCLLKSLELLKVQKLNNSIINAHHDNIYTLVEIGKLAHDNLSRFNMLDRNSQRQTKDALNFLDLYLPDLQPTLCHGDLSPFNIMRHNSELIIIDWEDVFLGVADYDYLFWLSFFENRRLYQHDPLRFISIDRRIAKALLILIVLLKCEIAWRSGSWSRHTLSFNERILEISKLD